MLDDAVELTVELTVEVAEGRAGPAIPGVLKPAERLRRGLLKSPSTPTDLRLARLLTLDRRPLAIVSLREV